MSVNKAILVGRLGQDPELKYTASGTAVTNFSVATNDSWTDKSGQRQERTEWHRIVVWGKQAENCNKYLKKGRQVFLEGSIQTRSWEDQNGNKRYTTEIVAKLVNFLSPPGDRDREEQEQQHNPNPDNEGNTANYNVASNDNFAADDLPF